MTEIKDIRFFKALLPLSRPIADATHQIEQIAMIVARLELETGVTGAECFDWVDPLITQAIRIEDGYAYPNDGPGWGFRFLDKYLTELV